jgi:ATP-dependent Lon protease
VIFPYVIMPLLVGRPESLVAVEQAASAGDRYIFVVAQRSGETAEPAAADLHRVGVVARILQVANGSNGTMKVLLEGLARGRVTRYVPSGSHLRAVVAPAPLRPASTEPAAAALARTVMSRFDDYVALQGRIPAEVVEVIQGMDRAQRQAFAIAAHLMVKVDARQRLLESGSIDALFRALGDALTSEIELLRLARKLDDDVRGSLVQNQREFYLQEQLKAIHRELGSGEADELGDLGEQIEAKALPEHAKTRAQRELRRLRRMPPMSPEFTVSRNYLDWILALPWSERTAEVPDLSRARSILDEDHFGLEEVKDRILDFIAVLALVRKMDGPILCLVGPPGVGKTSLGRSVARALGRRFVRMSLGGVRDEAEIRGHRRTYIGSMPGRILQAMRRAEVVDPVILLDEVDKLGQDYRGDPAAALLEVLDPEQNRAFNDHYLELDYDLSQTVFLTTANSMSGIPEALRDRMEIIRLPGYIDQEKLAIATGFLVPRQLRANGIDPATVEFESDVLSTMLQRYTREAGVREFERQIARVARKLARRRAESGDAATLQSVRVADFEALLGQQKYDPSDTTMEDKVGVASGLAYTAVGGEVLEIEVSAIEGRGKLQLTGTLGDVMKESANAALSFARGRAAALGLERDFHRGRDIHVHIPAGATPKDGPSAGIAIAAAIVSALTGIPVRGDVAMTGEITLRGRVLAIGGLKEKAVAAHRAGIRHVIIPHANARDLEELPGDVRSAVQFYPVRHMDDVLSVSLRGTPRALTPRVTLSSTVTPGGVPSGMPSSAPSGMPSGVPSGVPAGVAAGVPADIVAH